jgi:hypothetical protein
MLIIANMITQNLIETQKDLTDKKGKEGLVEIWKKEIENSIKYHQKSKELAKEIRTITIESVSLPSWKEAKKLLENAKVHKF